MFYIDERRFDSKEQAIEYMETAYPWVDESLIKNKPTGDIYE